MEVVTKPKMPKGRRVEIEAEVAISAAEKLKQGETGMELRAKRDKLIEERQKLRSEYDKEIKELTRESDRLLYEFHTGRGRRTVKAVEHRNFKTKKVEHWFNNEMVAEREMTETDHQEALPIEEGEGEE